jgi:hypothetical protein
MTRSKKCLYEGCVRDKEIRGFCKTCYLGGIAKAEERLKSDPHKILGRTPIFDYDLGEEELGPGFETPEGVKVHGA